jgi:NAD(P)-dependent dehydrogenase (short-subunit alcohol dehydrogenase family)
MFEADEGTGSEALARFSVAGRVACVTGASSGIGRALAGVLAEAGARVVGVARRADALKAWRDETEGETWAVAADLSDPASLAKVAERVSAPFGPPEILVSAAGINTRIHADEVRLEDWSQTLNLNLAAPFFLAQALVPAMRAKGWGRIVNIASLQTTRAFPNGISYGASKAGVGQLTRAMAEAWSRFGITANALAPGFFPTELAAPVFNDPALAAKNAAQTCIGRNGELDDLAGPLLFLASPASDYVTGQILHVDGGFTAK